MWTGHQTVGGALIFDPHYARTCCTCVHIFFVTQVIEGNLPWHKVVYGGPIDQMLESNQDPILVKIWTGKTKIKHPELAQSTLGVYNGENILIDWRTAFEPLAVVKYSTPSGKPLIHISDHPYLSSSILGKYTYSKSSHSEDSHSALFIL